jgi:hypothetical protein
VTVALATLSGRVAILALGGFHAWLFWSHLAGGRLFEPAVAVRWFAGLALVAAFVALRRLGLPVLRGRQAVVLWLLVALLHVHAAWAPGSTLAQGPAGDEAVVLVLQAASATALLGVGLVLLVIALRPRTRAPHCPAWFAQHARPAGHAADAWRLLLAPRPPPLR